MVGKQNSVKNIAVNNSEMSAEKQMIEKFYRPPGGECFGRQGFLQMAFRQQVQLRLARHIEIASQDRRPIALIYYLRDTMNLCGAKRMPQAEMRHEHFDNDPIDIETGFAQKARFARSWK